ncbi:tetratricopeptide repeat protein [Candidatus Kaiserbacteria bacterium]|nr:tetratricopeptide repeat protein [Candidatus Kaiserbacteria bacterium]
MPWARPRGWNSPSPKASSPPCARWAKAAAICKSPISPGSSGGGLFDEEGRLIGLPTFYLAEGQQLNFAVPVEFVQQLPQQAAKATAKPKGTSSADWLNRAAALEEKQDWPALQKHALAWTRAQPSNSMAWYSLGVVYRKQGETAKAIEAYQQALRIDPQHADAWNNLGVAYRKQGETAKAIEAYQQALRIDPQDADAWYNLGIAYGKQGQTAKEIEAYQEALRIVPQDADAWINLGIAYGKQGQTAKEIEAYQEALRIDPQDADAWYNLGVVYAILKNRSKVIEVYQVLKTLDPEQADRFFRAAILP